MKPLFKLLPVLLLFITISCNNNTGELFEKQKLEQTLNGKSSNNFNCYEALESVIFKKEVSKNSFCENVSKTDNLIEIIKKEFNRDIYPDFSLWEYVDEGSGCYTLYIATDNTWDSGTEFFFCDETLVSIDYWGFYDKSQGNLYDRNNKISYK